MINFLNSNGLIDGRIPAGTSCPFMSNCNMQSDRCPTEETTLPFDFSCGLARGLSLDIQSKESKW